jgi:hypothetical protein
MHNYAPEDYVCPFAARVQALAKAVALAMKAAQ